MSSGFVKKKSHSAVKKENLCHCIEEEGFVMTLPCVHCTCLGKSCIKLEDLSCCSKCVKATNCCCEMSEVSFSDAEWKHLVHAHQKLENDKE